jgi:hypothetical protein
LPDATSDSATIAEAKPSTMFSQTQPKSFQVWGSVATVLIHETKPRSAGRR